MFCWGKSLDDTLVPVSRSIVGTYSWIDGFERNLREHFEDEVLHVEKEADVTNYISNICICVYI